MNIAVNGRLLLSHRLEGVARYILETTRRMVLSNPQHTFHLFLDRPFDGDLIQADNLHIHILNPPARHPILWKIWFDWSLKRAMDRFNIDVLYSGESYLSLRSKIPVVMVSHDINYYHYPDHIRKSHLRYFKKYFPAFHQRADHIIAVSKFTKQDVMHAYGIEGDKISVAYNATPEGFEVLKENEKQRIKDQFAEGKDYFIYVGSLHPRKNVDVLINAFSEYRSRYTSDEKLIIYGRAAFKTKPIEKAFTQSEYKNDIIFLGNNDVGVHPILASAKALCYISLFEGFGIPILESFSCAVPVITSNISSMPEVAGDAALLVNPEDTHDIASAMNKISTDQTLVNILVQRGLKRKDDFSWDDSARKIMETIHAVAPNN